MQAIIPLSLLPWLNPALNWDYLYNLILPIKFLYNSQYPASCKVAKLKHLKYCLIYILIPNLFLLYL